MMVWSVFLSILVRLLLSLQVIPTKYGMVRGDAHVASISTSSSNSTRSSRRRKNKLLSTPSTTVPPSLSTILKKKITINDMICNHFEQPLNHYDLPRLRSGTYKQRYCYYNGFVIPTTNHNSNNDTTTRNFSVMNDNVSNTTPILLYVGNESPIEEYINNTGLMFEIGYEIHAQIIFIEHRYEGLSKPLPNISSCMAYSSSIQALADYANFIERVIFFNQSSSSSFFKNNIKKQKRPIVAFGGSYGGMLASWIRTMYPHLIIGSIASSAPVFSFPTQVPTKIDAAYRVIYRSLQYPYPPTVNTVVDDMETNTKSRQRMNHATSSRIEQETVTKPSSSSAGATTTTNQHQIQTNNNCTKNLLATWPLIQILGTSNREGRLILCKTFALCDCCLDCHDNHNNNNNNKTANMVQNFVTELINWGSSPWFDLAESSYPYPSSYISYALTKNDNVQLPAWPLQSACWINSTLYQDYGIEFVTTSNNNNNNNSTGTTNNNYTNNDPVQYDISFYELNRSSSTNNDSMSQQIKIGTIHVDWDHATLWNDTSIEAFIESPTIVSLLSAVKNAVSVWYNMTLNVSCYNVTSSAPNKNNKKRRIRRHFLKRPSSSSLLSSVSSQVSEESSSSLLSSDTATTFAATGRIEQEIDATTTTTNAMYFNSDNNNNDNATAACEMKMNTEGSWPSLACNEPMNLIVTEARGMGQRQQHSQHKQRDDDDDNDKDQDPSNNNYIPKEMYWPPSYPSWITTYNDILAYRYNRSQSNDDDDEEEENDDDCYDPFGFYGYPKYHQQTNGSSFSTNDPYCDGPDYLSILYDTVYGYDDTSISMNRYTNIIFSNGLLDPWSSAGVYAFGNDPTYCTYPLSSYHTNNNNNNNISSSCPGFDPIHEIVPGLYIQNLSSSTSSSSFLSFTPAIALIMEYGGHHTDFMYSSPEHDPSSIVMARQIEKQYIQEWIEQFWSNSKRQ